MLYPCNHLRLGNWVLKRAASDEKFISIQIAINDLIFFQNKQKEIWKYYELIYLSEEILGKTDFEFMIDIGHEAIFEHKKSGLVIARHRLYNNDLAVIKEWWSLSIQRKEELFQLVAGESLFSYLHQLQNLFLFLTNEELFIKI